MGKPKGLARALKERKREAAETRNESWSTLSFKQQLAELENRRGESKRQKARILRKIKLETG